MARNHPNNKILKESALSHAFTSTLLRFRHTAPSATYCCLTWRNRCGWK
jgi:hypothetical protein